MQVKLNTLMLCPVFLGAGAYNSFQKQNHLETQLSALQLNNRALENAGKCFFALLASYGMARVGVFGMLSAGSYTHGVIRYSSFGIFSAGVVGTLYGSYKAGEGMADLWQSQAKCP